MKLKSILILYLSLSTLLCIAPSKAKETHLNFKCSNGASFTLSSEGNIQDDFFYSDHFVTLHWQGSAYEMVTVKGGDNTRFYGTNNDYSMHFWKTVSLAKGDQSLGSDCQPF